MKPVYRVHHMFRLHRFTCFKNHEKEANTHFDDFKETKKETFLCWKLSLVTQSQCTNFSPDSPTMNVSPPECKQKNA